MMPLVLLDRDGVVIVNRATNVKTAADLELLAGAPEAIARLNRAGFDVAICTNQPEVARGVLSPERLDAVHQALKAILASRGATVDVILCCGYDRKCPRRKLAGGMLREALARYRALPAETPFVDDQAVDLKAAFHAGCRRVLVRTGLGRKTLEQGLPQYLSPVAVHDDLTSVVDACLAGRFQEGARDSPLSGLVSGEG
jgi:D-glycero-D-manno-heptose 1,7-bisphosphate phosphatase